MSEKNETALRAALEQAESHEDPDAVKRAEKQLAAVGYKQAAKKRQAAAKDDDAARSRPPSNRSAPRKQTTRTRREESKSSDGDA